MPTARADAPRSTRGVCAIPGAGASTPCTGTLWAGDVGQDNWEEIDVIEKGKNYGWRCYEGQVTYNTSGCGPMSNYTFPIAVCSHSLGFAVTGGYVYHGTQIPELRGVHVTATTAPAGIWGIDANHEPLPNVLIDTPRAISSFAQDHERRDLCRRLQRGRLSIASIAHRECARSERAGSTHCPDSDVSALSP